MTCKSVSIYLVKTKQKDKGWGDYDVHCIHDLDNYIYILRLFPKSKNEIDLLGICTYFTMTRNFVS